MASVVAAHASFAGVVPRPVLLPTRKGGQTRKAKGGAIRHRSSSSSKRCVVAATSSSSETPAAQQTTKPKPSGFGFSAAGMIFPYHVGAWEALSELGLMTADTPVAGASAGALVAAMHACGMAPQQGKRVLMSVLADCRDNGVVGRVGSVLEAALRRELPPDAHLRCSGNLFVSLTSPAFVSPGAGSDGVIKGFNGGPLALEGELVSEFADFEDLLGALLSSCHIPLYCGWPARNYRGKLRVDGGWTQLTPTPPGCEDTAVRVSSFPLLEPWGQSPPGDGSATGNFFEQQATFWDGWGDWDRRGGLIAPDGAGGTPAVDYMTLGKWALLPASDDVLEELVRLGRADTQRWAAANGYLVFPPYEAPELGSEVGSEELERWAPAGQRF